MSGGMVTRVGWDGLIKLMDEKAHEAWRVGAGEEDCPWCGAPLVVAAAANASKMNISLPDAVRALAERFAEDPFAWTIAMLLVVNPAGTDRDFAGAIGVSKTKVNDARRRLREACPELAGLSAGFDRTIQAQENRRAEEGTAQGAPPPLVGTIKNRVHSRFAQRAEHSPTQRVHILADTIEGLE